MIKHNPLHPDSSQRNKLLFPPDRPSPARHPFLITSALVSVLLSVSCHEASPRCWSDSYTCSVFFLTIPWSPTLTLFDHLYVLLPWFHQARLRNFVSVTFQLLELITDVLDNVRDSTRSAAVRFRGVLSDQHGLFLTSLRGTSEISFYSLNKSRNI